MQPHELDGLAPLQHAISSHAPYHESSALRHYREERDWLGKLPGLGQAASLLAAHAAGRMMLLHPERDVPSPDMVEILAALSASRPRRGDLEAASTSSSPASVHMFAPTASVPWQSPRHSGPLPAPQSIFSSPVATIASPSRLRPASTNTAVRPRRAPT